MTRGIYGAATTMLAEESALQAVAQSLAFTVKTGDRQESPVFKSFDEPLVSLNEHNGAQAGAPDRGASFDKASQDFVAGLRQAAGDALDLVLRGKASLAVKSSAGVSHALDGANSIFAPAIGLPSSGRVRGSPDP